MLAMTGCHRFLNLPEAFDQYWLSTYCFAGENEEIREKIAAGLGAFAQHCSVEEVRQMLAGPVAAPSGQPAARMGSALIIANTAQFAPQRQAPTSISNLVADLCCAHPSANGAAFVQTSNASI